LSIIVVVVDTPFGRDGDLDGDDSGRRQRRWRQRRKGWRR